jgi:hypothetical protein
MPCPLPMSMSMPMYPHHRMPCHAIPLNSSPPTLYGHCRKFCPYLDPLISKYGSSNRRKPGMGTFFGAKFKIVRWWGFFFIVELIILDGPMLYSICADDLNTTSFLVFKSHWLDSITSYHLMPCHAIHIIPSSYPLIPSSHATSFPAPPPFLYGYCRKFCLFEKKSMGGEMSFRPLVRPHRSFTSLFSHPCDKF